MSQERLYSISELAAMFDISPRTIRYYEEVGLLASETRASPTQQRYYTNTERRRLKLILRGKRLGFSLQEIKEMVDMYESNPTGEEERRRILAYADRKLREIDEKIAELEMLKADILANREKFLKETETKGESE
ncbi:MerR family DNA-binding protein [Effusibacillus pohliae]|uniref:MerR family DNA-binding protein n=1 Tax=Effusibacillus pohliae TaxID=232270 RepID=UPI000382D389|nr:MerR family DNA-binding protein [Effusibacillus pohliae]